MFNNKRFATNGIMQEIPLCIQNMLWYMIETMEIKNKDYLQIFKLSDILVDSTKKQKIIHTQENPSYKKEYIIDATQPINAKVFVIDDITHSTMLLAEEY